MTVSHRPHIGAVAATVLSVIISTGCQPRVKPRPYTAVGIEMQIIDKHEKNQEEHSYAESLSRLSCAGPQAVAELAQALESPKGSHRFMASYALRAMTGSWNWPEAWDFVIERLGKLDSISKEESGELIAAVANERVKEHPVLLLWAGAYLDDTDVVRPVWLSPDNKIEMRVCDYAAYIVQAISGVRIGASPYTRSDDVVRKARAWVRENMEHKENGKTVFRVPEALTKDR